jgi:hypothetical protein
MHEVGMITSAPTSSSSTALTGVSNPAPFHVGSPDFCGTGAWRARSRGSSSIGAGVRSEPAVSTHPIEQPSSGCKTNLAHYSKCKRLHIGSCPGELARRLLGIVNVPVDGVGARNDATSR